MGPQLLAHDHCGTGEFAAAPRRRAPSPSWTRNCSALADQEPETVEGAYEKAVATQVLQDRERALSALRQRHILVVDSPAEKLSAELVNKYLEVKERMLV